MRPINLAMDLSSHPVPIQTLLLANILIRIAAPIPIEKSDSILCCKVKRPGLTINKTEIGRRNESDRSENNRIIGVPNRSVNTPSEKRYMK